ncbi:MAG: glucose-phosphatase [Patescibacteria group bacterium]|nr:glucose-phosphatase [Patescibacteria group bacterium]
MKTILVDAINTFVIKDQGIDQEMFGILQSFPNRKIILTNADDEQMKEFGLGEMPFEVFSLKHNPDKIDPKYYEKMLSHFGLNAEDVIYFEHNADAVKSAQSVGIKTHHFDKDKRDLNALKDFLER